MNIKKRALIQYVINKNNNIPVYRTPEFADNLSGKVVKLNYSSSDPISIISFNTRNNNYLVSTNSSAYEAVMYEMGDSASDGSWNIVTFTALLTIGEEKVYECVTTVKMTYNTSTGQQTSQEVQSIQEKIRKEYVTLPDNFGTLITYGGTALGITPQVDGSKVTKRGYTLSALSKTDKINSNGLLLMPEFPINIDKTWFPTAPAANEYGNVELDSKYTLLNISKEYTVSGQEYPSAYTYYIAAAMQKTNNIYYFMMMGSEELQGVTFCYKEYGASTAQIWNQPFLVPGCPIEITLTDLNTSSPLYPYIKKVIWN